MDNPKETSKEEEKQELLHKTELSLYINDYDYLFSDFDPSHYSQRAISDDFLYEAKRIVKEKPSGIEELHIMIPKDKRSIYAENIIRKRLKEHFKAQHSQVHKEIKKIILQGTYFLIIGTILMLASAYILFEYPQQTFLLSMLITLFQPASWFLFWEGLNLVIFKKEQKRPDLEFYEKMSKVEVHFLPI